MMNDNQRACETKLMTAKDRLSNVGQMCYILSDKRKHKNAFYKEALALWGMVDNHEACAKAIEWDVHKADTILERAYYLYEKLATECQAIKDQADREFADEINYYLANIPRSLEEARNETL